MKSFLEYLKESEDTFDRPVRGDNFAINICEETLLETYICDETHDGIVLHADERFMEALESYGLLGEPLVENYDFEIDSDKDNIAVVDQGEYDQEGDMAKDELATMIRAARKLTGMLDDNENMPEWVQKKISKAADYVDTAADYIESNKEQDVDEDLSRRGFLRGLGAAALAGAAGSATAGPNDPGFARRVQDKHLEMIEKNPRYAKEHAALQLPLSRGIIGNAAETNKRWAIKTAELLQKYGVTVNEAEMDEAKYQGRKVPLGKPMAGDVKKSKVYVRGPKGNVVKVNFGQKGMKIKKNIPGRRKNFRARHNCDNPGPRWKARYWSCRAW